MEDITTTIAAERAVIEQLFSDFELAEDDQKAEKIIDDLCHQLRLHKCIEVIFPFVEFEDDLFIAKNIEEHEVLQYFVEELCACDKEDRETIIVKLRILAEFFRHHVMHEEYELFPYLDQHGEKHKELLDRFTEFREQQRARLIYRDQRAIA
ncbi:MAG: hypothetical protein DBW62_07835 [Microbacterium sp.]|nr:MAG: hypothetical protein DBW62_07835 [Microbacterium sp.]